MKKKKKLTCFETQVMITDFLENRLSPRELEQFLNHVNECASCMEELEVYYTLTAGIRLLDEPKQSGNDFHKEFELSLKRAEDQVFYEKARRVLKWVLFVLMALGLSCFLA